MDTPNVKNVSVRPTAVEGAILCFIGCVLAIVTDGPTLSAASRAAAKFEISQVPGQSQSPPKSEVIFHTVGKGNRSGVREFQQQVARNQSEWETLWQRHTATETKPADPPAVDFNKELVIAIFLGEKPTGGHSVEITLIERKDRDLVVSYKELQPAPGAMTIQALTQPFHVVRVATSHDSKVSFRRES